MIKGYFGKRGELFFKLDLLAANGVIVTVDALLDTGFIDWLTINTFDAESLGWSLLKRERRLANQGKTTFNIYTGVIIFDAEDINIPVITSENTNEIVMGLPWLENRWLFVDRKAGILKLGNDFDMVKVG
jgi:predicted aspartyl protease